MTDRPGRRLAAVMFTDMVGFTALMQENEPLGIEKRARYKQALEAQHEAFGGRIVQYFGDGALSLFSDSVDAVSCGVEIQRELTRPPEVPVRVGIHVGNVIEEPGSVIGDAANIASRIESFGVPGGVLVSDSVHDQVKNQPQLDFVDLGRFRLKNVGRVFGIFAVATDDLVVPPAGFLEGNGARLGGLPDTLPEPATPLIGREADLTALAELIGQHRVVTVTGPGGVGKTRTAIEACWRLGSTFPDGVSFASLSAVTDPSGFPSALAGALDAKEVEGRSEIDGIISLVGDKHALILLDNMEQIVDAAPDVARIAAACPRLRILVTSRTPLRIGAERQYALDPLALPPIGNVQESPLAYPGVALFVERAKVADSGFDLTEDNTETIVEICRRMDGLPLALELAAARVRLLRPDALLARLDHALGVLTSGRRDRPERHQTLRAAIDWSHSLLDATQQRLFRRMAVFAGGCSLEAVEAVCAEGGEPVLNALESLVDEALVQVDSDGRFSMLQTIREYALEQLHSEEEADRIWYRYAAHYAEVADEVGHGIEHDTQVESVHRGGTEEVNLHAGLDILFARANGGDEPSAKLGLRMCRDLWMYWHIRAKHLSAKHYATRFLDFPAAAEPTIDRAGTLLALGLASVSLGHFETGVEQWEESYRIAQELDSGPEAALVALSLGVGYLTLDVGSAMSWTRRGIALGREIEFPFALGLALTFNGILHAMSGAGDTAADRYEEALAIQQSLGDMEGAGLSLGGLAQLASMGGNLPEAVRQYRESLAAFETIGDRFEGARILAEMAWTYLSAGEPATARGFFLESVEAYTGFESVRGVGTSMIGLAACEAVDGRARRAVQIAAAAEVFAHEEGLVNVYSTDQPGHGYVEEAKAELSADDLEQATSDGRRLSVKEAVELAKDLVLVAE